MHFKIISEKIYKKICSVQTSITLPNYFRIKELIMNNVFVCLTKKDLKFKIFFLNTFYIHLSNKLFDKFWFIEHMKSGYQKNKIQRCCQNTKGLFSISLFPFFLEKSFRVNKTLIII